MTREEFESILDGDPENWDLRLVYADWLEENGDLRLSKAQRWMVKRKVRPSIPGELERTEGRSWRWGSQYKWFPEGNGWPSRFSVPTKVYDLLEARTEEYGGSYDTRIEAEADLAGVLERLNGRKNLS